METELNQLQQDLLLKATKSLEESKQLTSRLELILDKLNSTSGNIVNHCIHGNLKDQAINSKLWHELYNIEHQLKQFNSFTKKSFKTFEDSSMKLVEDLGRLRPKRED